MKPETIRGLCPKGHEWSANVDHLNRILTANECWGLMDNSGCPICILAARPGLEARP